MGDMRNKIMKLQRAEAEKRGMAALLASLGSPAPSPSRKGLLSLKCEGCGLDSKDQCRPDGTFTRLFSVAGDRWWKPNKIYCEFCLERLTGEKPDGIA
jgi:hypothetical protein